MADTSRHDAWQAGDSYEAYMGRWSRQIAPRFLAWLKAPPGKDWLEIGCGTGALSAAILAHGRPKSLQSIDSSPDFVAKARATMPDARATFLIGDAQALGLETASRDIAVSALVLNFVPAKEKMLAEMKRVTRPGGTVGFYVWDYPGGGVEFMQAFWTAATALDPGAREFDESTRFAYCTEDALVALARGAGLAAVECTAIELPTMFRNFDDFWRPFTLGAGPAPGYCAKLDAPARERLKGRLFQKLLNGHDGPINLTMRAWAVKASVG